MKTAYRVALFAILVAGSARAQELLWENNFGAAVARARAEKRLILADLRSDCERCNQKIDARLKWAELHESVVASLGTFVLVRGAALPKNLAKSSALVVADPAGEPVIELPIESDDRLASALQQVRVATPTILHASEQRLAGDVAGADMNLGMAFLLLGDPSRAAARLEAASHAYESRHDVVNARLAEIQQGFALFVARGVGLGHIGSGYIVVEQALRNATTNDVRASAWLALGAMERIERQVLDANNAYRNAYRLASPGSEVLAEAREALAASDDEPLPSKEGPPAKGTLRILVPARRTIAGKAAFIAESDPAATRVDFFLDDAPAGTSTRPPFRVRIDLGPSPRVRRIKAIAYDAAGRAIAESVATVNDRADALRVTIVAPLQKSVAGNTLIGAEVAAPEGRRIAHVDFFWKEQLLERIDKPPYRTTHDLPADFGYLRVVATLDDGTTADDTHVLNATATAEEVSVGAITFLASVVDAKGNVIRGLTTADFLVEDAGARLNASVRSLEGEPVTIGLAVDSSGSMQLLYLSAIETASSFIGATLSPADRIFLVSFDNTAHLVTPATNDAGVLSAALQSLLPSGGTSLWDGIAFSLQQLQEIPGRKALVVISDGIELMSGQSEESCARLAKTLGIPIYAIVPQASSNQGVRAPPGTTLARLGSAASMNPAFAGLARETGGELINRPHDADLPQIFARIRDTVRGQYLVSFTASPGLKSGSWRALTLRVPARGVVVRSVAGYYVP